MSRRSYSNGFFEFKGVSTQSAYADNFYDNHAEYGAAGQDIRYNLNGHATYTLPFGRGRAYGSNMNRVLNEVVGGWKSAFLQWLPTRDFPLV